MTIVEFTVRIASKAQVESDLLRIPEMAGAIGDDPDILEDKIKEAICSISDDYRSSDILVEIPEDTIKVISTSKKSED